MEPGIARQSIPKTNSGVVIWHRRDLRTSDHPALTYATEHHEEVIPLFIFDPSFYGKDGLACDSRIQFLHECLDDLHEQYLSGTGRLTFAHGEPIAVLSAFRRRGWDIVARAEPTSRYGWQRDNAAAKECNVTFLDADGIVRTEGNSRDGWSSQAEEWFTTEQYSWDQSALRFLSVETAITPTKIAQEYGITPQKNRVPIGGRTPALRRLDYFAEQIEKYPSNISSPAKAETGTSRLSPYLRFGCLSVREAFQYIQHHCPNNHAREMFLSRLYWNRHYNQKLEDWPGWTVTAVNPVLRGFHRETHDPVLVSAWKDGKTGYPLVDASMRCLKKTGWLNFRMRAMCISFLCDLLQQPWRIGADWFYYHLIDADPAINYTQAQTQAGVVGVHMERVYNPRKQVRDNDPDAEFIKQWVHELVDLPSKFLDKPEKTPLSVQRDCGILIGEDYPYPIIEYEQAREAIYKKIELVKSEAQAALRKDEIKRRASLSQRGRGSRQTTSTSDQSNDSSQLFLDDFS